MNKTIHIAPDELPALINQHEAFGARPCRLTLACPVDAAKFHRQTPEDKVAKQAKQPNRLGTIIKHTDQSCILNFNYAGNVNRQREREGKVADFQSEANWFEHETPAVVVSRKTGERYVFVRVLSRLSEPTFTIDGISIDRGIVVSVLPADSLTDDERAVYGLGPKPVNEKQDLDKEIAPIAVKLANVVRLVVDNVEYIVTPTVAPALPAPTAKPTQKQLNDMKLFCDEYVAIHKSPPDFIGQQ